MTCKDLIFSQIDETPNGPVSQAIVRFDNNLGLSVLCGPGTLTNEDTPYEVAVISFSEDGSFSLIYPDFTHDDVLSYLTEQQVSDYMEKVSNLSGNWSL